MHRDCSPRLGADDIDDGLHVVLLVRGKSLVSGAVEVDGKVRDAQRGRCGDELGRAVGKRDRTGKNEFAVEPAGEDGSSVHLDTSLAEPTGDRFRLGLEFEAGRIRVRTDDTDGLYRNGLGEPPREDCPAHRHDVSTRRVIPRAGEGLLGKTGVEKDGRSLVSGMEGAGARINVVSKRTHGVKGTRHEHRGEHEACAYLTAAQLRVPR